MKKSTQTKGPAAKKPATKQPAAKPAAKPTTKPTNKPTAKPTSKPSTKPCDKKVSNTKEKEKVVDKRAFVSGEAPKKIEKVEIKERTEMKCIKTIQAHDDWVEKALILSNGKVVTIG